MRVHSRKRTVIYRLLIVGLQVPALVFLQSCKNDSTEKAEAPNSRDRAVFGGAPGRAASERRPVSPQTTRQPKTEITEPQVRSRTAEPHDPEPRTAVQQPTTIVGDPGERGARDKGRDSGAEPFLGYRPPGSHVGDPGERTARAPEPQLSTSGKLIRDLLRKWADTLLTRDLAGHMSLYTPVARQSTKASKQRLLSKLEDLRRFEMRDVRLMYLDSDSAIAEFRIESDAVTSGVAGFYRLELRQLSGEWKIAAEDVSQPVSGRRARR
jgi:hypothetical protein